MRWDETFGCDINARGRALNNALRASTNGWICGLVT